MMFLSKYYWFLFFLPNMECFNTQMFNQLSVKLMVKIKSVESHLHCTEQGDIQWNWKATNLMLVSITEETLHRTIHLQNLPSESQGLARLKKEIAMATS